MASLTQWTWIWVDSRSWWWTGRPGVLCFMGLQWVGGDEGLNWTELNWIALQCFFFFFNVAKCVVFATQGCESAISKQYVSYILSLPPISPPGPIPLGHHRTLGDSPVLYSSFPLGAVFLFYSVFLFCITLYIILYILYFYFQHVYMSMLLSQFIQPSPSPAVSTSPFSTSVSLFLTWK